MGATRWVMGTGRCGPCRSVHLPPSPPCSVSGPCCLAVAMPPARSGWGRQVGSSSARHNSRQTTCQAQRSGTRPVKPRRRKSRSSTSEASETAGQCSVKAAACDIDETARPKAGAKPTERPAKPEPRPEGSSDKQEGLPISDPEPKPPWRILPAHLPMAKMVERVVRSDVVLLVDILGTLMLSVCYGLDTLALTDLEREAIGAVEIDTTIYFAGLFFARWYASDMSWKTVFSPLGLVDLISVAPLLSSVRSTGSFLRVVRVLKIARLLQRDELSRLVSLAAGKRIDVQDYQLKITQAGFTLFSVIWVTAGVVYEAESGAGMDTFSNFFDALYYSITTLTSVGFGDIVPQSAMGKTVTTGAVLLYSVLIPYELAILAQSLGFMNDSKEGVKTGPAQRTAVCTQCHAENHQIDAIYCRRCGERLPPA